MVERIVKPIIIHFKKVVHSATTLIFRQLRQFWHLAGLLLFEPTSCLLCQVELGAEIFSSAKENDGPKPDAAAIIERGAKLRDYASTRLCLDCMDFFCSLPEIKTTLIGDDDGPTIDCFSSGFYNGPLQEAVYQIKYLKRPELAQALAFALLPPTLALIQTREDAQPSPREKTGILVVPVPLHSSKLKERGFNQAEELATGVGKLLGLKLDGKSLQRIRPTRAQFGLSRGERRRNLDGAFRASNDLAGRKVILVDDVLTSGATLYECTRAIAAAGGIVVGGVTLARARWQKRNQPEDSTIVPGISLVL
jgi:ComF family protein